MTTTVHIPDKLMAALDHKVKELHISRNKYICVVLEKELANIWPEEFARKGLLKNKMLTESVDQMLKGMRLNRINKKGITL